MTFSYNDLVITVNEDIKRSKCKKVKVRVIIGNMYRVREQN